MNAKPATCPRCQCDTMTAGTCYECGYSAAKSDQPSFPYGMATCTESDFRQAYKLWRRTGRQSRSYPHIPVAALQAWQREVAAHEAKIAATADLAERYALELAFLDAPKPWPAR